MVNPTVSEVHAQVEQLDQEVNALRYELHTERADSKLVTDGLCWMLLGCAALLAPVPVGAGCITIGGWKLVRAWLF